MVNRKVSLSATGALAASALLAGYAVLANANLGESDAPKPTQNEIQPALPTPTAAVAVAPTRAATDALLQTSSPATLEAIRAVEAKDTARLKSSLAWREFECSATGVDSVAPSCSQAGVPAGTRVPMFLYELTAYSYRIEQDTLRILDELLGPSPRLGLVARRGDGSYLVTFTVGATDPNQPRGVSFTVSPDSGGKFSSYTEKFAGSTPLDDLREFDRRQTSPSQLIYVSDEVLQWEQEKHQMQTNPTVVPNQ